MSKKLNYSNSIVYKGETKVRRKGRGFEMNKGFKKFIAVVCAIAMVVTSVTVYKSADVRAAEPDWSTIEWAGDGAEGGALANTYKFYSEIGNLVNIQKPGFASKSSFYVTFPEGISECSLGTDNYEIQGAGIALHVDVFVQKVTEFTVTYGGKTAICYVYNDKGIEGEITTPDPNAPTTTPAPTTTTELQKPAAPTGLVANINDLKTNYTIAFAPVTGATSFKLYIDGEYKRDIGNGTPVTIAELGLEAGKTYTFGVSAVNEAGESDIATIQVTVPTAEDPSQAESTAPVEITTPEEFDPSTITDWTAISSTVSIYDKDSKLNVKEMHGNDLYLAFGMAGAFKSITLDGVAKTPGGGADFTVSAADIATEGIHTLVIVDYYGTTTATVYIKCTKPEETTTAPDEYVDGAVLVNETEVVKEVPAYTGGNPWQAEFNNTPVKYVKGKKYVAEVVVSSNVDKAIKLVFQNTEGWSFIDTDGGYEVSISAGNKVKITYVFEATQGTDNGNYDIYLGSVADAATLNFESKTLTTYNEVPEGVVTGVEVLSTPSKTEYSVTIDGEVTKVEAGTALTLPETAKYGYTINGTNYKAGSEIVVNEDITVESINVALTMTDGAGIKLSDPTGIRFQAHLETNASIKESGMLLSANDLMDAASVSELTTDAQVEKVNISNGTGTGRYIGALVNINNQNYARNFTARAYVTISYGDSDVTYYSESSMTRNIKDVANGLINAGKTTGLTDAQMELIDTFAGR